MRPTTRRPFPWRAVRIGPDRFVLDLWDGSHWRPWNDYAITARQARRFMAEARRMRFGA